MPKAFAVIEPDYRGGGIANLAASLLAGLGAGRTALPGAILLPPERIAAARHVLLLVVDGMGEALAYPPHSALLARRRGRLTSVFPSTTASAVTTLMTGEPPAHHALTGWFMQCRELGGVIAPLPFALRLGYAPLEPLGVKAERFFAHTTLFERIGRTAHALLPAYIADSPFSRSHTRGARVTPHTTLEQLFANLERLIRQGGEPLFLHAYWSELDALAHRFGPDGHEVTTHLAEIDGHFGRFMARIAGSDTLVIVTADHGLIGTTPEHTIHLEHHPQLETLLEAPLCGEPRTAYCYVKRGCEGAFRNYVETELAHACVVRESPELIDAGWFGPPPHHPRLAERVGHFTLLMRDDYVIKDRLMGERPFSQLGVHGGLSPQEMWVPLIVAPA